MQTVAHAKIEVNRYSTILYTETGVPRWSERAKSEFSTIDTAATLAGALMRFSHALFRNIVLFS